MKRVGSCTITRQEDVDTLAFDWGKIRMLSDGRSTGAASFSFGSVELARDRGHTRHNHPDADEIIYVVDGEGEQMLADEPAVRVTAGDCIWIPRGVFHATVNRGAGVMRLIVVYAPAGAEVALRDDPAVTITPARGS